MRSSACRWSSRTTSHGEGKKLIALIAVKLLAIALAATAAFSVFRIAFGG